MVAICVIVGDRIKSRFWRIQSSTICPT